jgi:hypothetical protein
MPETPLALHGDIGEDYNIRTIVSVALIGFLSLVMIVIWLKAIWGRAERWEWENRVVRAPFSDLQETRSAEEERLQTYAWTDAAKDKVAVPLAQAIPAVIAELQQAQQAQALKTRTGNPQAQMQQPVASAAPAPAGAAGGGASAPAAGQAAGSSTAPSASAGSAQEK